MLKVQADGISSVLIYLTIYLAMTLGSFACILAMRKGQYVSEAISDLAGISREKPLFAFLFAMLLFSLAGVPPLAGFFAKFYVFNAAIQAHLYWLAVVGVVLSVVGAYYYLRIVKIMYFDEAGRNFRPHPGIGAIHAWRLGGLRDPVFPHTKHAQGCRRCGLALALLRRGPAKICFSCPALRKPRFDECRGAASVWLGRGGSVLDRRG